MLSTTPFVNYTGMRNKSGLIFSFVTSFDLGLRGKSHPQSHNGYGPYPSELAGLAVRDDLGVATNHG